MQTLRIGDAKRGEEVAEAGSAEFIQTGVVAEDCWQGSQTPGRIAALGR